MTTTPLSVEGTLPDDAAPSPSPTPALEELRPLLTGRLVTPADADWHTVRLPWNVLVDQRPDAVVLAATAEDVVATVRHAAANGLAVTAQPGGHGASRALDGTVLIRTRSLDDIWIDGAARVARVGAGVTWGALQSALDGTGLTGLIGSNPDVTVVGYALGGGVSWFSRAFGTGAGSVRAVEVVDAAGHHRWVTDTDEPDLLWALRGGGGDYGIVTAAEIDLFPAPVIQGGMIVFPGETAPAVLRAFAGATRTAPRELTLWAQVMHFPDVPFLPEEVRGQSFTMVVHTFLGDAAEADRLLAPIRSAAPVLRDTTRTIQPGEVGLVAEEPVDPSPAMLGATRLHTFDDAAIDALVQVAGVGSGTPLMQVQVRHIGGALTEERLPAAAGTADEPYVLSGLSMVPVPELAAPVSGALDGLLAVMAPWSTGTAPLTFLDRDDSITRCYPESTLERLRAVKRAVDPHGIIRSNRPVPMT